MPPENETTEETGMNIEEAAAGIASDIFGPSEEPEVVESEEPEQQEQAEQVETMPAETVVVRAAPSSWAKEQHEHWAKMPREAQDYVELREKQMLEGLGQYKADATYGKQIRDVLAPHSQLLAAQGIDAPRAVQTLLSTHAKLSTASPADKLATILDIAKHYGVQLTPGEQAPANPELQYVKEKLTSLESALTAREQAELTQARSRVASEVEAFSSDPANPYFDEVAEDIVAMINIGMPLKDAYEKAVWANPVTRQKELARLQTEADAKTRETAKKEAEAARKAAGVNVRSRDTRRAPTEPLGTMEDTMKSTLTAIRERAH